MSAIDEEKLSTEIDSVLHDNVPSSTRGLSALVSIDGKILYHNAFGQIDELGFSYNKDTIFDLASLTKPLVTSLLMCRLLAKGKISLKDSIADIGLFREFPNLGKFTIENLMTHTSGLIPDKPLYTAGKDRRAYLSGIEVEAEKATVNKKELYSDLNYILLGFVLEELHNQPLDVIWKHEISEKLGLKNSGFNPHQNKERIAPTEVTEDRGLVWGKVHDEKSYYLGGVAGHAGLFSTASEVNRIIHSLMTGELLKRSVWELATRNKNAHLGGMFGLGWMTKVPVPEVKSESFDFNGFMGEISPYGTFGHTGFTGTSICINSDMKLACILLTNRVYPTRENIKNLRLRRLFHNTVFLNLS